MSPSAVKTAKTKSETKENVGRAWGLNLKTRIWGTRTREGEEQVHLCFHPSNDLVTAYAKAKVPIGRAATHLWLHRPKDLSKAKVAAKDGSGLTNRNLGWMPRHPNYDDLMGMEKAGVSFDGWLNLRLREELPNAGKWNLGTRAKKTPAAPKAKPATPRKRGTRKSPSAEAAKPAPRTTKRQETDAKLMREVPPTIPTVAPSPGAHAGRSIHGDDVPALSFGR
jgi:hypothetical protein